MMALSVLFSRVQRVDELSETLPRNLDADTEENEGGEPEKAIWRATLLRVAFESPSVKGRKMGAIPGALIIGVRVAKTTNAFWNNANVAVH